MNTRTLASILVVTLAVLLSATVARADIVVLKDGSEVTGIIKKVADGKVVVEANGREMTLNILSVATMDFTTPHLVTGDHFTEGFEAQEIVNNINDIERTANDIQFKLDQIKGYWGKKETVTAEEESGWFAAKEEFRKPLTLYQELLNDLYFHVLAKVDEYNALAADARKVYVGVKGPFKVGSALVPSELQRLPLRKYVPATWWDTIYFNGYNMGYEDATQSLRAQQPDNTN